MLSPGQSYKDVPKDLGLNLEFRQWIWARADRNKRVRDTLIETCRHDLLFYVNVFCFTFDPRPRKTYPFVTYPFQDTGLVLGDHAKGQYSILECVEDRRDLVIYKSRDMGATWMVIVANEWLWKFSRDFSSLMISRNEDLVDKPGDPDCLFWKIDFLHRLQPEWLQPKGYKRSDKHFENPQSNCTIDGAATTQASGVGGRRTAVFIDELSRIKDAARLIEGTADTTDCRIYNFTPFGESHPSFKLTQNDALRKLRLHWSEHPTKSAGLYRYSPDLKRLEILDKTYSFPEGYPFILDGKLRSPSYDEQWNRRQNPREMAVMWDIDFQGSKFRFFDEALINELISQYAVEPMWQGDLRLDQDTAEILEWMPGSDGPLKLWLPYEEGKQAPADHYSAGADISLGLGATNSSFALGSRRTGRKVLEYTTPNLEPRRFAAVCVALCRWAHGAYLIWEAQGPGQTFGKRVIELGFMNFYFRKDEQKLGAKEENKKPGWYPSPDNQRDLLQSYRAALTERRFINHSEEALDECNQFEHTSTGTIEHSERSTTDDPTKARLNHADRVIADALCWKGLEGRSGTIEQPKDDAPKPGSLAYRRMKRAAFAREEANSSW